MFRRIVAMSMLVSIVAMATSGAMMFVIERPSFTIQMHPVHKLFGLLMIVSAIAHITLNFSSIRAHLRSRSAVIVVSILTTVFIAGWGGFPAIGTPEQIVEKLAMISAAGLDGIALSFVN